MLTFQPVPAELSGNRLVQLNVYRAKVVGGWIVVVIQAGAGGPAPAPFFISDPDHRWDGSSIPD